MTEDACRLSPHQRERVHRQTAETCRHKAWTLHAVNCRSNHVHVVLSSVAAPRIIREQLKAWCTRRLNQHQLELGIPAEERRSNWWTERGSIRWIYSESHLVHAIGYVLNQQANPDRFDGQEARRVSEDNK
jgi:REP element-mobilizing transposase RayT